jgi:hypothetical protein
MTDLDDRIRNLTAELVQSAPPPSPYPRTGRHTATRRPLVLVLALVAAAAVGIAALWVHLDQHQTTSVAVSSPTPATTVPLSNVQQLFLDQLRFGTVGPGVDGLPATASSVTALQVKEVQWSAFVQAAKIQTTLPGPGQPIYVEVAIGKFTILGTPNVPCLIVAREIEAPYSILTVTGSANRTFPGWFTALRNIG